jgi:hypothetical protein
MSKAAPGVSPAMKIRESQTAPRRYLLKAAGAALLGAPAATAPPFRLPEDPTVAACDAWLAQQAEIARLGRLWSRRESWLAARFSWFRMSETERRALPEAQALYEIDARCDALWSENERLLRRLARLSATSLEGVHASSSSSPARSRRMSFRTSIGCCEARLEIWERCARREAAIPRFLLGPRAFRPASFLRRPKKNARLKARGPKAEAGAARPRGRRRGNMLGILLMSLVIENPRAEEMARELARHTGVSPAEAVAAALEATLGATPAAPDDARRAAGIASLDALRKALADRAGDWPEWDELKNWAEDGRD